MKIHLPFLLLFAVVSTCTASPGLSGQSSSNHDNSPINLSLDLSADVDEGHESRAKESSKVIGAATSHFPIFSQVPEFGMRNPKSSAAASEQGDPQRDYGEYSSRDQQQAASNAFEPISTAYRAESSPVQSMTREFVPNVYRKPLFDGNGGGEGRGEPQFGQAHSIPNEMDSPFYSKSGGGQNGESNGNGLPFSDNGDDSGFAPIAMSVDEAFRKYFPPRKTEESDQSGGGGADGGGALADQQQLPQELPPAQGQTKYVTTYADNVAEPGQQQQQQPAPVPSKEVFSIDSLRDIVEKEPLARPNPFDPPSPPLSSFLPPPEGAVQNAVPSQLVPQYGVANSQPQSRYEQQPLANFIFPKQQQQAQVESNIRTETLPPSAVPQPFQIQQSLPSPLPQQRVPQPEEGDAPEEGEDEGLPYSTDNLDDEGKKVSYVYSRPVQLPDVTTTKVVDYESGRVKSNDGPYQQDVVEPRDPAPQHIYRKPVSYENEEDSVDGQGEDIQLNKQVRPAAFEEGKQGAFIPDSQGPKGELKQIGGSVASPFQGGLAPLPPPPQQVSQPVVVSHYQSISHQPLPPQSQPQWTSTENRPDFDQGPKDSNQGPQNIEYGGFVPIKKPGGPNFPLPPPQSDFLERPPQNQASYDIVPPQKNFFQDQPLQQQQQQRPFIPQGPNFAGPGPNEQIGQNNLNNINNMNNNYNNLNNFGPNQNVNPHKFNAANFLSKLPNMRFKPLYGRDAMKKLRELGISEDEFYGTVNKILQKSNNGGPRPNGQNGPLYGGQLQYMPKANLYRSPPKNGGLNGGGRPMLPNKMRPLSNNIADEFDFNYFKDGLPPGASYNPLDVGLDESVLAQIHLQDSGIGGHRFPTMLPTGAMSTLGAVPGAKPYRANFRPFNKKPSPLKASAYLSNTVPQAMTSMTVPYILTGPRPFRGRVPYSATGKGFRSQYGYRAAASELKPQFAAMPAKSTKTFKFLGQPVALGSSNVSPLLAGGSPASFDLDSAGSLGNILGIRSIKGIKSLVSYLTGGVHG